MALFTVPVAYQPVSSYEDPRDHKAADVQEFLRKIAQLESSSGDNVEHPMMQDGMHSGTHAVGQYGLMPLTAQDIDRQSGNNQLQDLDKQQAQDELEKDPELSDRLAATLASKLLSKNPSDIAAYKWNQGQFSHPTDDILNNNNYVRKFKVLNQLPEEDEE